VSAIDYMPELVAGLAVAVLLPLAVVPLSPGAIGVGVAPPLEVAEVDVCAVVMGVVVHAANDSASVTADTAVRKVRFMMNSSRLSNELSV
jgi:hypothetical protein